MERDTESTVDTTDKRRKKENQITFQATDQYLIMDIWKIK